MRWGHLAAVQLAALIAAGCTPTKAPETATEDAVAIRTAEAAPATLDDTIVAVGTVRLRREAALGFTTAGRIAAIHVDAGYRVRRGQVLATLDTTTVGAELAAASAERTRAAADLARARDLFAKGWLTRARLDAAEASYRTAAANTDAAAFAARTARIAAPADGIVLSREAEVDQVVTAGAPVIGFGSGSEGYVLQAPLTDRQSAGLKVGAIADVRIAAIGNRAITGRIVEIAGRADPATGAFMVEVELPQVAGLRSGQIGEASITVPGESGRQAVFVPSRAIFAARADEAFVYVVDPAGKRVEARKIVPGATGDRGTEVLAGLRPGERVATTGIATLRNGARVEPSLEPGA